ncbi:hypothetical protein P879_09862 [Paragonimus westermani]|uniref:Uncharacterized protein n=1 Tax=Paragonimus westermani TaxID=34504 RepID=A0A8T0DDH4_9TREM|nr:hypothetical protein P879_09862 [Paragonimus westermani]
MPLQLFRNNPPVTVETLQNVIRNLDSTPEEESCLDDTVVIDSEDCLDMDDSDTLNLPVEFRRQTTE